MRHSGALLQDPFWWAAGWAGSSCDHPHTIWHQGRLQGEEDNGSWGVRCLEHSKGSGRATAAANIGVSIMLHEAVKL